MKILDKVIENQNVRKGSILKATDLILTPYRKAFNGRKVQIIFNDKRIPNVQILSDQSHGVKRLAWTIVGVSMFPIAATAALVKPILSLKPIKIGYGSQCVKMNEVIESLRSLKKAKISAAIFVYTALGEKYQNLPTLEAEDLFAETLPKNIFRTITANRRTNGMVKVCLEVSSDYR